MKPFHQRLNQQPQRWLDLLIDASLLAAILILVNTLSLSH